MNYRHAFHAGGVADVFKHLVLVALLQRCKQKEAPFFVLDTHGGIGLYDLQGEEAQKTGEYKSGIDRLMQSRVWSAPLAAYVGEVARFNQGTELACYPGSPALLGNILRGGDRAAICELHEADCDTLKRAMKRYANIAVHRRDGYEAIGAFLPPPEKRGLIFVDPPFEMTDEFSRLVSAIRAGGRKFPGGIWAIWYPIKDRAAIWRFHQEIADMGRGNPLAVEFITTKETDPFALNGSGVVLINPPFRFADELAPALAELQGLIAPLGRHEIIDLADS